MRVNLRGSNIGVAEQLLNGTDVVAALEQVGRKAVAQAVTGGALGESCLTRGMNDGALYRAFMEVMAAAFSGGKMHICARGGEEPLPEPVALRVGILASKGIGHHDAACASGKIALKERAHTCDVLEQRLDQISGQHRAPVFPAFAIAHEQLTTLEIDILDTELACFE
jgi:hypothetical protein